MGRKSKQKSCSACVDAKRRCDRSLPACTRCLEREVDCAYPTLRRPAYRPSPGGLDVASRMDAAWDLDASWLGVQGNEANIDVQGQLMEGFDESILAPGTLDEPVFVPSQSSDYDATASSTSPPLVAHIGSCTAASPTSPATDRLSWFLVSRSWDIAYHYHPPACAPPPAVFTNFVRGLQDWLVRFLRKGHNPFIHRHLYPERNMPRCMQDAYAAIAVAQNATPDNEHIVDAASSRYILDLLASQPTGEPSFPLLTTREHLARTQALLIHVVLSLFSSSIARRAQAESAINTLRLWARQLWDSATLDATTSAVCPNTLSLSEEVGPDAKESVPSLYRAFLLSESIRRTFLLTSIATGVYGSIKTIWSETCGGDICITTRAELWNATSSARWEAVARKEDPLFMHSLHGQSLAERGVPAAEVDEFARLLFTVMWGLEKVERWVVSTGDTVSVMY